ncbi:hypothetical protein HPB50_005381 [Hyalomma asiaticum]|uniref:Uncharacterized protein n=1 Tax=Hyalomma asiaticum TaxID=266040 RepID=A0ACB7RJC8_HYAAI|nr:hypothetical protein HPB50_005381 [Hyalomma asiaticum]
MFILKWIFWFTSAHSVAGLSHDSFPFVLSTSMHQELPHHVTRVLPHCSEHFYRCSQGLVSYSTDMNVVACSCAHNCVVYGDCCWDVTLPTTPGAQMAKASCVEVRVSPAKKIHVSMVTGCLTTWPKDSVRSACERPESYGDTFHIIPATGATGITYRNGFCALCNNDITNATFWNVVLHGPEGVSTSCLQGSYEVRDLFT